MNNRTKSGSVTRTSIILSILIALSGMAAIVLADDLVTPNRFSGTVTLNGAPAPNETVINAFIDGNPRGSIVVESPGEYEYLSVNGSASDDGKNVTFTVCDANAGQNGTWIAMIAHVQTLDLTAVDSVAPAVTNANATPSSIVADGAETTLIVTVTDGCRCTVDTVTVDLSDIGGDAAQNMTRIGDTDVYSVTVTAAEGTAPGAHCLQVNASDVFGNYDDTSVCIALTIQDVGAPVVSNPDADPASIVANGTHESQLSVTVVDDSDIDFVTVDLSDIGGDAAKAMSRVGTTDVYSVTVTAAEGTAGAHCLYVNASDVVGNYNNSVCIDLVIQEIQDVEAPVVSNPGADPASIVANGTQESQLSVTVVDESDIDFVTVDLSDIGGDAAQAMSRVGDTDVYSVTVTAVEGTAGAHCLYVNASDVVGICNTSVCIALEVTSAGLPKDGNINGIGGVTLADAIYLAKHVAQMSGYETLHADGNINGIGGVTLADAIYLAKHVAQMSGYETLY